MGACHSSSDHHPRHKHPPSDGRPNLNSLDNHTSTKVSSHSSMPDSNIDKISPYTKYDDINKYYTLGSHRGSGSFGIVREAVEQTTNQKFAVKTVWKAQFVDKKKFIQQEIEILMQVEHDNIIKCYQVYEDMNSIHFVFDLIEGGELFDYLINSPGRVIPESRAVDLFNQILDSLQYLHDKNIVHRDIKPENFLIYHSGNKIKLKLIDFGFATVVKEGEKLTDKVGSLQYIAPEMLSDNDYDSKIDMWASGVVLYNMLTGKQPFFGKGDSELINNILNSQVVFSEIFFKNQNAKNICQNLLQKDPNKRFSANDAKASMWIQNFINIDILPTIQGAKFAPKEENIKNILNLLNQQSNIKAEIWNMMLTYFTLDNMIQLRTKLYEVRDQNCLVGEAVEGTIGGKDFCPYQVFLQTILDNITIVPEFYDKISGIKYFNFNIKFRNFYFRYIKHKARSLPETSCKFQRLNG